VTSQRDYLIEHLIAIPSFRALLRAVEARKIAALHLPRPILDLGCGDGHFAQAAFTEPLDVGIDPSPQAIAEAATRKMHRELEVMDSNAMSFADGTFGTVLSNSVVEHIPDIDATLIESCRVLKPGGLLVFTTTSQHYAEYLFFPTLFRRLALKRWAKAYEDYFNRISRVYRNDSAQTWSERLERAGFRVIECHEYFSRSAMNFFDLMHYYSAVTLFYKKLLGRWIIAPWRGNFLLIEPAFRHYYNERPQQNGAYLFFLCERR
jgi:ubiquinone/menaquinone biosynthesis C-methylase UbiE